jgi:hypothetical protein
MRSSEKVTNAATSFHHAKLGPKLVSTLHKIEAFGLLAKARGSFGGQASIGDAQNGPARPIQSPWLTPPDAIEMCIARRLRIKPAQLV